MKQMLAVLPLTIISGLAHASANVQITGNEAIKAFKAMTSQGIKEIAQEHALAKTGPNIQCLVKYDEKAKNLTLIPNGSFCVLTVSCKGVAANVDDRNDESCEQE